LRRLSGCLAIFFWLSGCALPPREPAPLYRDADVAPVGFPAEIRWVQETTRSGFEAHAAWMDKRLRRASHGRPLEILAVSGGGANGAFGAGVLVGWSKTGTRPAFDVVTGVSAGALIAPFAFLGRDWDPQLRAAFSGETSIGLLQARTLGALFGLSFFDGEPLRKLVDRYVTDELVHAVAAEAAKGRILLAATTNLDQQKLVFWDLGAIALHPGPGGMALFKQILVASASIPGAFPPVLVRVEGGGRTYDEMHVDGGTRASVLAVPDIAAVFEGEMVPVRGAHVYLLINGKLKAAEASTPTDSLSILRRALATSLNGEVRSRLLLTYSFARRHGIDLKVAALNNDYPQDDFLDFSPGRMQALFSFGEGCASLFRVWGEALDVLDASVVERAPARAAGPAQCPLPDVDAP
jgi:predicted acylesterase/phospholipase RssA